MLTLSGVTKTFPGQSSPAIEALDLSIRDGEILGLVGLNGAGKTTTIRVAAGVARPTAGSIVVDGYDLQAEKIHASEHVGWLPELIPFEPSAKAVQLLTFYAGFNGIPAPQARNTARDVLAEVGLQGAERQPIRTFSLGMKKRFGLATVMITDPRNLLLDEVLNGLDPEGIAFVRTWSTRQKRRGKALLVSSHLLSELESIADRIAFVHRGRLIRVIAGEELSRAAGAVVRLRIENVDAGGLAYLRTLGRVREEGRQIVLTESEVPASELNSELVRRGYRVAELRVEGDSLEGYFLRLLDTLQ